MKNGIYINKNSNSKLNIKLSFFYKKMLLYIFLTIISLGILFPYTYEKYCELIINNSYIDNKKLIFKGTVKTAYIEFLKNLVYSFIIVIIFIHIYPVFEVLASFGANLGDFLSPKIIKLVYSIPTIIIVYFIVTRMYKWKLLNIYFLNRADECILLPKTKLLYKFKVMILLYLLSKIVYVFTASLSYPFSFFCKAKYNYERIIIDDKSLIFLKLQYSIITFFKILPLYIFGTFTLGLGTPLLMYYGNQYIITNLKRTKVK